MRRFFSAVVVLSSLLICLIWYSISFGRVGGVQRFHYMYPQNTVIGAVHYHSVRSGETMFDIARMYGLGINSLRLLYPQADLWVLPRGLQLMIPTMWVLPPVRPVGIVLNIPEFRLYYFDSEDRTVQVYPVGIGEDEWETPVGSYRIIDKRENPAWYIPESLQHKYGMKVMPPGPNNPLGEYAMRFAPSYGIHGTNTPWGVGMKVSHGCVRLYPEHIRVLFPQVEVGTPVEIIYMPIKLGVGSGRIYAEVHPDIYGKIGNFYEYAMRVLSSFPYRDRVDQRKYMAVVAAKNGMPMDVTLDSLPGPGRF